jgi:hypothetical protein
MRNARIGLLAVVAAGLLGTSSAWACDVLGTVACVSDPSKPVNGVAVTLDAVYYDDVTLISGAGGTAGAFSYHVNGDSWTVSPGSQTFACTAEQAALGPIVLHPILVDDPVQCPEIPVCTPTPPTGVVFPYCPARPIGNPKSECALFGLAVLDKNDFASSAGLSTVATDTAPVALVKAAGCYSVFYNVVKDVTVLTAPGTNAISHVTYCTCK